jgi:hypothetical protein
MLLGSSKKGCLGVLRVPAYSLRRRSPVLLGFPGLRRPVGVDLAPIVRFMPRANGCGHVAFPFRRDSAETRLVLKRVGRERMVGFKSSVPPVRPNNRFAFDLGIRDRTARSYERIAVHPLYCLCTTLIHLTGTPDPTLFMRRGQLQC